MGLFSRKPKPDRTPVLRINGLEISYDAKIECWNFCFEGVDFTAFGPKFSYPGQEVLQSILNDVQKLTPEMLRRIRKEWEQSGDADKALKEISEPSIFLTDYSSSGEYEISWCGKPPSDDPRALPYWGDMGVEFQIKDHEIVEEQWGD